MDSIYAFSDPSHKSNKNYGSHKENYLRFAIEVFIRRLDLQFTELINELEKQYIPDQQDQYPILEGKEYWIRVV